jgi:hypothetical protein
MKCTVLIAILVIIYCLNEVKKPKKNFQQVNNGLSMKSAINGVNNDADKKDQCDASVEITDTKKLHGYLDNLRKTD